MLSCIWLFLHQSKISQVRVRVQCAQLPPRLPARRVRLQRLRRSPLHHRKVQVGQISSSAVFGLKLHKSRPFGERLVTLSDQKQVARYLCSTYLVQEDTFCQIRNSAVLLLFSDWAHSHLLYQVQLSRYKRGFHHQKVHFYAVSTLFLSKYFYKYCSVCPSRTLRTPSSLTAPWSG